MVSLVTGASGFLGGALAERLAKTEGSVRVLLRNQGQAERFRDLPGTFEVQHGDLGNLTALTKAVAGVSRIYHCAAASTDWADWETYESANVDGVQNLVDAAVGIDGLERFVHVSTTDVYGYPKQVGDESSSMLDVGLPYNQTKIRSEEIVRQAEREHGLPLTVLRPATIYGPGSNDFAAEILVQLKQRSMPLIAGGHTSPGLLYIDNAVSAMINAAGSEATLGGVYNLRDETTESWKEYLNAFAAHGDLPRPWLRLPYRFAWGMGATLEQVHTRLKIKSKPLLTRHAVQILARPADFAIDRAKADFGFGSEVGFDDAVAATVAWAKASAEADGPRKSISR